MRKPSDRLILLAIVLLAVLLRLPSFFCRVWSVDEAAMAAVATLVQQDGVLYRDAVDHHAPLSDYIYAATFFVGGRYNMFALRLVLTGLIIVVVLAVYGLGRLAIGRRGGLFAALLFAVLASFAYTTREMYAFHTEWTVILFTSLGSLLLARSAIGDRHPAWAFVGGCCFGLAVFSKQPAAVDLLAALLFLAYLGVLAVKREERGGVGRAVKMVVMLLAGVVAVSLAVAAFFHAVGAWDEFVFQFYTYNADYYVVSVPLIERLLGSRHDFFNAGEPFNLAALATMGVILVLLPLLRRSSRTKRRRHPAQVFLVLWATASFVAAAMSGRLFPHYYIQLLPSWCLLGGLALQHFSEIVEAAAAKSRPIVAGRIRATAWLLMGLLIWMPGMAVQNGALLYRHWAHPDPAIVQAAEYIRQHSDADEKIFVWGFLPDVYVLSDRVPASRYTFCNWLTGLIPWTNADPRIDTSDKIVPGSWETLMKELQTNRPVFIVDTTPGDYLRYIKYPIDKFPLLQRFVAEHYEPVGEFPDSAEKVMIRVYRVAGSPPPSEQEG